MEVVKLQYVVVCFMIKALILEDQSPSRMQNIIGLMSTFPENFLKIRSQLLSYFANK